MTARRVRGEVGLWLSVAFLGIGAFVIAALAVAVPLIVYGAGIGLIVAACWLVLRWTGVVP